MGITFKEFCNLVEYQAPLSLQAPWDNSGGILHLHDSVENVLVCLDITSETLEYALKNGFDTLLSHHPLIFSPIRQVSASDYTGALLLQAVRGGLNIYSAHTSYDFFEKGMNAAVMEELGLREIKPLSACLPEGGEYFGAYGIFPKPLLFTKFLNLLKEILNVPVLRYSGYQESVKSVVYAGGSGGDMIGAALALKADAFVTGEVRHHQYFHSGQILMIEAGHYDTEKHFTRHMTNGLQKYADGLKYHLRVCTCEIEKRPYSFS